METDKEKLIIIEKISKNNAAIPDKEYAIKELSFLKKIPILTIYLINFHDGCICLYLSKNMFIVS